MKKVSLSFDNGPTANVTPFVLRTLAERDLPAYFCIIGEQLCADDGNASLCREALSLGHMLVNHSLTHKIPLGEFPTTEHARSEIGVMHELMQASIGDWGAPWFRPFGREGALGTHVFSKAALDEFCSMNYSVMLWNSVPRDWIDTDGWMERAYADIAQRDHTLLVLHDIDTGAMRHLPAFLDTLLDKDICFTLDLPAECVPVKDGVADPVRLEGLVAEV